MLRIEIERRPLAAPFDHSAAVEGRGAAGEPFQLIGIGPNLSQRFAHGPHQSERMLTVQTDSRVRVAWSVGHLCHAGCKIGSRSL